MSAAAEAGDRTGTPDPVVLAGEREAVGAQGQGVRSVDARPGVDHSALWRRAITLTLLVLAVIGALVAVPDLHPVVSEISDMNPALVAAAIVLELASCVSFVLIFRVFFSPLDPIAAAELAWVQMGSGALIPGGGAGSLAVGGWLLHLAGMPTRQIVQRSSGLFFLTSAINVLSLGAAGLALSLGVGNGPHDILRAGLPVLVAAGAISAVLALSPLSRRFSRRHRHAGWVVDVSAGISAARRALVHPSWRLSGAVGYLFFDIAVLWVTLAAVGPLPPVAALAIAYLVGYLANAIPVPGGIGVLDAGLVGALAIYGLPLTHAAAAVLVYHAIAFWIPTLGGTLAYLPLRRRLPHGPTDARSTAERGPAEVSS
jgi:uncharacterized membrane protein YbhN (UPF0104 family)